MNGKKELSDDELEQVCGGRTLTIDDLKEIANIS